ncbi:MAG: acyl-CoA dehydratase activase [bacterium]|jgi:predicted CoA-substrate-specific enzyme activase|nr:acyl-CoA dehydratase activase [candidate division KSB1 bacterium]MDH7558891.1 acyl-CoA dehydratase activase [bacterium]
MWCGIDVGSSHVKIAVLDDRGDIKVALSRPAKGRPLPTLAKMLLQVERRIKTQDAALVVTGVGKELLSTLLELPVENELLAAARGAGQLCPEAASLIEVGGQFTKWIQLEPSQGAEHVGIGDYAMNELCAAGSGAFLEEQAARLQISVEELGELAAQAPRGATIAGRCSVFAKSDMIHLQQKGTPLAEIAYGLCLALARNFVTTVLAGRQLALPVALIGGAMANKGLVRAFREVLRLEAEKAGVPPYHEFFPAIGAALAAQEQHAPVLRLRTLRRNLMAATESAEARDHRLPPLSPPATRAIPEPKGEKLLSAPTPAFLGVDVGSVSTNLVLLDERGQVLAGVYLPTRGRPIEALQEGFAQLRQQCGRRVQVLAAGTTGSGRHLAGRFVGADVVKNEITAQMVSTLFYFPEADTIFEIGGQDSKYISIQEGRIADFTMNKSCAAGTGSFLEEQAQRLGISIIDEFAELAFASSRPVDLGSRCTVFMDGEVAHSQARGVPLPDMAAGLAYSIARNYLEKVVGNRRIGNAIVFQGGVASNQAVIAAFSSILGKEVKVHPYNRISGAIGAALLAQRHYQKEGRPMRFRGMELVQEYTVSSFECAHCANRCQVNRIHFGTEVVHFGDTCERYTSRETSKTSRTPQPDLFAEYVTLLESHLPPEGGEVRGRVGLPRASLFHELLPFWASLFSELRFQPVLSGRSSPTLLARAMAALPSESCLPVKVTFGHVLELLDNDVDLVVLPSVLELPPTESAETDHSHACLYTQALPYMVEASVRARELTPQMRFTEEFEGLAEGLQALREQLGVEEDELVAAYRHAKRTYAEFKARLERRGKEILKGRFERAVVVLGRPYNTFDPFLNLNLAAHLNRLGILAIPMSYLPLRSIRLGEQWRDLPWKFPRDMVRAALFTLQDERLFPIIVSNFGCGPDGFTQKHLERVLRGKPHLFLEFDEHRGEAGLITRLEAFLEEIEAAPRSLRAPGVLRAGEKEERAAKVRHFFIPYFADHAHAFAGVLRAAGHQVDLLPPPDEESRRLGTQLSSGKECHPFSLLVGDMAKLIQSRKLPEDSVFFFPGTSMPCLLAQYGSAHGLALKELAVDRIEVMTPDTAGFFTLLKPAGMLNLWRGLVIIDLLLKATCEVRPYEKVPGSADHAYQQSLKEIELALAGEVNLGFALEHCIARLESVELRPHKPRPIVGVAGDIYTRVNPFANDELFYRLEAMGCEVWPSPFLVDTTEFGARHALERGLSRRKAAEVLKSTALVLAEEHEAKLIRERFHERLGLAPDAGYDEIQAMVRPYLGADTTSILLLNVAKVVEFARRGVNGVINAYCFNCMVGNATAALIKRIGRERGNLPITSLVYGDASAAALTTRLEAFVHQVKRHYCRTRMRAAKAPV